MLAAPDVSELPGITNNSFLEILLRRMGKPAALLCWFTVCAMAAGCVQTVMHANARSFFAFASDKALPSVFARMSPTTKTPLNAVWLVVAGSMLLGSLHWASSSSLEAVFSMCAVALDLSYVVPVACRLIFQCVPIQTASRLSVPALRASDAPSLRLPVQEPPGGAVQARPVLHRQAVEPNHRLLHVRLDGLRVHGPQHGASGSASGAPPATAADDPPLQPTRRPLTAATFNWSWVITLGILAVSLLVRPHLRLATPTSRRP